MTGQTLQARRQPQGFGSLVLIAAGALLVVLGGARLAADAQVFGSAQAEALPFDDVPQGFVPLLAAEAGQAIGRDPAQTIPELRFEERALDLGSARPIPLPDPGNPPAANLANANSEPALTAGAPARLRIASIGLDVPIVPVPYREVVHMGRTFRQWLAPNARAAGWHLSSPGVGVPGNTVLNGHHNVYGEVFRDLEDLSVGDFIHIEAEDGTLFVYQITVRTILEERYQPLEVRLSNARWIHPTADERLTLITCWPYQSNSHRLILVARPFTSASAEPVTPPR